MYEESSAEKVNLDQAPLYRSIIKKDKNSYQVSEKEVYQNNYRNSRNHSRVSYPQVEKKVQQKEIKTMNKEEDLWEMFFPCCATVPVEPEFQDCDYCKTRIYKKPEEQSESDDEPYMSVNRMKVRQKQPINIFYDQIKNQKLVKETWE